MKAVVVAVLNDTLFYLTPESYASDRPERAREFRDLTDAALQAAKERRDAAWGNDLAKRWSPAYVVGTCVVSPEGWNYPASYQRLA